MRSIVDPRTSQRRRPFNCAVFRTFKQACAKSSLPFFSSSFLVHEGKIVKIVWIPPEYGDAVACISEDGIVSLLEEIVEDSQPLQWKICK